MSEVIYRDGSYLANNPSWHEEDSPWKARQIIRLLEANRLKPSTICEIGCGAGGILTSMAREMSPTTRFKGYEISPDAFALCASKRASNVQFSLTDLLAEDAEHFDVALAIDVFEHVEDYFGFLRKLKPRATYKVFHIPLDMSVLWTLLKWPIVNGRNRVGLLHERYRPCDAARQRLRDRRLLLYARRSRTAQPVGPRPLLEIASKGSVRCAPRFCRAAFGWVFASSAREVIA